MTVPGDAAGCAALGTALTRAASGIGAASTDLAQARSATSGWRGDAADRWRDAEVRQQGAADRLAQALRAAGQALGSFAEALTEAQALASAALRAADSAGLRVASGGAVAPVHVPRGPYATPEQASAAREASDRSAARQEVLSRLAAAEGVEQEAHAALLRALRGLEPSAPPARPAVPEGGGGPSLPAPGWNDGVDLLTGLVLAPNAAYSRASSVAQERGAFAKQIKSLPRQGDAAARSAARSEWRAALRQMRAAQRAADLHALRVARLQPVSGWLGHLNRPLAATPVLRHVPGLSVVMTGVGTGVDVHQGMDPVHAVVKNTASTAAGMAAGAATTAAVGALVAGGTIALAPVAAGVVVGAGVGMAVGWVVGEYGDDVAGAVSDMADGAADLAGSVWGKIT